MISAFKKNLNKQTIKKANVTELTFIQNWVIENLRLISWNQTRLSLRS